MSEAATATSAGQLLHEVREALGRECGRIVRAWAVDSRPEHGIALDALTRPLRAAGLYPLAERTTILSLLIRGLCPAPSAALEDGATESGNEARSRERPIDIGRRIDGQPKPPTSRQGQSPLAPIRSAAIDTVADRWRDRLAQDNASGTAVMTEPTIVLDAAIAKVLPEAQRAHSALAWAVARDGQYFVRPDGHREELAHRPTLSRILAALVAASAHQNVIGWRGLATAGWPDEYISQRVHSVRVRAAIATLRRLGLRSYILTTSQGWTLDLTHCVTTSV